jgi:hypothetical protein
MEVMNVIFLEFDDIASTYAFAIKIPAAWVVYIFVKPASDYVSYNIFAICKSSCTICVGFIN